MSEFQTVARLDDVPEDSLHGVVMGDLAIVIVNRGGAIFALDDCCSHEEFPLSSGELTGGEITCVLHGARFDIETGQPRALPAVLPVKTYETRVEGDEIQVRLDG
ncbi:MAG: non-heme iron oxygenase ferredoxin subunit [Gemmatimonadota bacterium]|nr:non-heme iron oxygenase ferredoxin subunit [Gemmatimonadota bacterium]